MASESSLNPSANIVTPKRNHLRLIGILVSPLILWNGVGDLIYGYYPDLNGIDYFSPALWDAILTIPNRPHWLLMVSQTASWLYPIYVLFLYHWWVGMRQAGFWLAHIPCLLLAYALIMMGGIQHAGWAFLSVPAQAENLVGSSDPSFYATVQRLIIEHFFLGDLSPVLAFIAGIIWHATGILSGRTLYPRWFIVVSPLGVLVLTIVVGILLPAPIAGFILAPFGTWLMVIPLIASTVWLWNRDYSG